MRMLPLLMIVGLATGCRTAGLMFPYQRTNDLPDLSRRADDPAPRPTAEMPQPVAPAPQDPGPSAAPAGGTDPREMTLLERLASARAAHRRALEDLIGFYGPNAESPAAAEARRELSALDRPGR